MTTGYKLNEPTVSLYVEKLMHKILDDTPHLIRALKTTGYVIDPIWNGLGLPMIMWRNGLRHWQRNVN